jgi:hypothetical protein
VPDFFVRHPMERPTRTLALSLRQGIKQSPKSPAFRFRRIVDHTSSVQAGQMLQLVDDKEFRHNKVSATIPTLFNLVSSQLHTLRCINLPIGQDTHYRTSKLRIRNSLEQSRRGSEIRAGLSRTPKCNSKRNGADTKTCEIDQTKGHRDRLNQPRLPSLLSPQSN